MLRALFIVFLSIATVLTAALLWTQLFWYSYVVEFTMWIPTVVIMFAWTRLLLPDYRLYRRRKRGLCVKCGYDLTGNESGVCPECGSSIKPQK